VFEKNLIVYNGNFIPEINFRISAGNRAFLYNDSLFETFFCLPQKVIFFDDHFNRLISGMKILEMNIPEKFISRKEQIKEEIISLLKHNKINTSARVRFKVFRKEGGLYTPDNNDIEYIISTEKLKEKEFVLNEYGLTIGDFSKILKQKTSFSSFKSQDSMIYILAGKFAKKNSFDDCIIYNTENNVCETISSNIFIVKENKIFTPTISEGIIDGVMRKNVIQTAKDAGFDIEETIIKSEDLIKSDEVFLTNSISGIKWVIAYQEKRYYNNKSKKFIQLINEKFIR
jgi:branched-chain amino acid aminotransferase